MVRSCERGIFHLILAIDLAYIKKANRIAGRPDTAQIPDGSLRYFANSYLSIGETIFNIAAGQSVTSQYFKRT